MHEKRRYLKRLIEHSKVKSGKIMRRRFRLLSGKRRKRGREELLRENLCDN